CSAAPLVDRVYRYLLYAPEMVYPGAGRAGTDRESAARPRAPVVEPWATGLAGTASAASAELADSWLSLADLSARERTICAGHAPGARIRGSRPDDRRPQLLASTEARDTAGHRHGGVHVPTRDKHPMFLVAGRPLP